MGSTKSTPGLSKARGKFLTDKTLKGTRKAHASDKLAHLPDGSPPCAAYSHVPCGAHTAALSFPRLASLASGPGRSLLGLCVSQQHLKSVDRFQSKRKPVLRFAREPAKPSTPLIRIHRHGVGLGSVTM